MHLALEWMMNIDDDDDDNTDLLWSRQRIQDDVNVNDDNSGGQKEIFFHCSFVCESPFDSSMLCCYHWWEWQTTEKYTKRLFIKVVTKHAIYMPYAVTFFYVQAFCEFFFFLWTMLEQLWFDSIRFFSVWLINYISVHKRRSSMINVCVLTFCGAIWIANWQYLFLILGRCQQYEEIISSFISSSSLVKIN